MSKLNGTLQQALAFWRSDLAYAQSGDHPEMPLADVEQRRVAITVTYTGELDALRAAGMQTGIEEPGTVSGYILLRDVERLEAVPGVSAIEMPPNVRIMLDETVAEMRVPWKVPPTTPWPGKGAGAIVAVIDSGIDIFHESFRKADNTTRILELWDQSASTGGAAPPAKFTRGGRVYSRADINAALIAGPPFVSIDDNGHGTHVAGIAAGNGSQDDRCSFPGRYVGVAPEADLVICKAIALTTPLPGDSREAMVWCSEAPARLGVDKPIVVNCSFGTDTGPHDDNGALDVQVRNILRPGPPPGVPRAGIAFVVAAGNAGAYETHESGTVPANGSSTISFYLGSGSKLPNNLDIWYTGAAALNIEVIAPPNPAQAGPVSTGPVAPPSPTVPLPIGLMRIGISFSGPYGANGNRNRLEVAIALANGLPPSTEIRPGVWQITLTNTTATPALWNAWFASKHGDTFPTFKLPGDPDVTPRRRENTISEPGTSHEAITVASYSNEGDQALAESSSRGPNSIPVGLPAGAYKPTVAAPGVAVRSSRSRNDPETPSSCCDQKVVDLDGTSMAAPHVAGLVALIFEKNKTLTYEQARAHLQRAARIDGIPAAEVPPIYNADLGIRANQLWGSGKVNAAQTLADIPAATIAGGGGGGGDGGGGLPFVGGDLGYTAPTLGSRLSQLGLRFGPRPGLMLFSSLVSEHLDEVLRLVNHNKRVGAVWRRNGGPLLVRRLLYGPPPQASLLPAAIEGCDVTTLLNRFLAILIRFGGPRLQADIVRFRSFVDEWPGGDFQRLDDAAARVGAA